MRPRSVAKDPKPGDLVLHQDREPVCYRFVLEITEDPYSVGYSYGEGTRPSPGDPTAFCAHTAWEAWCSGAKKIPKEGLGKVLGPSPGETLGEWRVLTVLGDLIKVVLRDGSTQAITFRRWEAQRHQLERTR